MNSRIQKIPPPTPPAPRIWTSLDLVKWTTDYFQKKSIESPRLEAEMLLAEVLGCPRIRLYVDFEKPVPAEKLATFREFVKRRAETREPIQYILGHTEFIDLKLKVTKDVLIPRPETEILALWAVDKLKARAEEISPTAKVEETPAPVVTEPATETQPVSALKVAAPLPEPALPIKSIVSALDLCTGSGCIALFVASKEVRARVLATDVSPAALTVASENAAALKLESRVTFLQSDLFAVLPVSEKRSFDVIISNPPYIDPSIKDTLQPEVRDHEPAQALFADNRGLAILRHIIENSKEWLKAGGWMGIEFGAGQQDAVKTFAEAANTYENIEIRCDENKLPRFLLAQRKI
jgi:release factor glutamine methyltransferase